MSQLFRDVFMCNCMNDRSNFINTFPFQLVNFDPIRASVCGCNTVPDSVRSLPSPAFTDALLNSGFLQGGCCGCKSIFDEPLVQQIAFR